MGEYIAAGAAIICAVVAALSNVHVARIGKEVEEERKRTERRAERRAKESRLSMDMMYATVGLAMDTAKALRDGHTNGTVAGDLEEAQKAREAYENFVRNEVATAVAKV